MAERLVYRSTSVGRSLQEVLEEMINSGNFTESEAKEVMEQFDQVTRFKSGFSVI
jgi:polyhydroxyalkanoate synthesis regulator phasin